LKAFPLFLPQNTHALVLFANPLYKWVYFLNLLHRHSSIPWDTACW